MKNFKLKSYDGKMLEMYVWNNVEKPIGVVQLIHGMSEYLKRYDDFAKFLNSKGFIVIGDDHRGHGKTAGKIDNIGKVEGDGDIFNQTLLDELFIIKKYRKEYNNLPYFIFSHSYGSFITQKLIQVNKVKINGVVICGSAYMKNNFGIILGRCVASLRPKKSIAKFIEWASFNKYNKKFKTGKWITRNEEICKKYYADKYSTVPFSNGFYKSMFAGMLNNYTKNGLNKIPKNLPLFVISGNDDPVCNGGKLFYKLCNMYKNLGLTNFNSKIYVGARHELINEINNEEVYNDILNFYKNNINK